MTADVFNFAAIVLVWVAGALGAFALLGDTLVQRVKRWRGTARKRCPKCWYDLSHGAANDAGHVTCSECGYVVTRERQFYKGRRRWGLMAIALVLLLGSYAAHVTPAVRERGMVAAVPTTALILAMPWLGSPEPPSASGTPAAFTLRDELAWEISVRAWMPERLWNWQTKLLVERSLRGDSERRPLSEEWRKFYGHALWALESMTADETWWRARAEAIAEAHLSARPVLPAGVPIYAKWHLDRWDAYQRHHVIFEPIDDGLARAQVVAGGPSDCNPFEEFWTDHMVLLGVPDIAADSVRFRADVSILEFDTDVLRPVRSHDLNVPMQFVASIDDVLEPVVSPDAERFILEHLDPALIGSLTRDEFSLRIWRRWHEFELPDQLHDATIGFRMEVARRGVVVGEAFAWYSFDSDGWGSPLNWQQPVKLTWFDAEGHSFTGDEEWTVRLTGDPATALRNFNSDRYWKGQIELPLRLDVWAER